MTTIQYYNTLPRHSYDTYPKNMLTMAPPLPANSKPKRNENGGGVAKEISTDSWVSALQFNAAA